MIRREFIARGSSAVLMSLLPPSLARAQPAAVPVIGFIHSSRRDGYLNLLISFRKGLAEQGFADGQNVAIEYRFAEGDFDRLPAFATELVERGAAVMVSGGLTSALSVRKVSASIPLVFLAGDDPVKFGLVTSLNRPGGATTGVAWLTSELFTKRLEFTRQLVTDAALIGVLINPRSPEVEPQVKDIEAAARSIGQSLLFGKASAAAHFEPVFADFTARRIGALMVSNDPLFNGERERIIALAARHRIPTLYDRREWTASGGLISYGTSYAAAYREIGIYAGKILKGAKPGDLPIEQATKFELVINLKTAAALGVEIPPKMLALADEVFE